MDRANDAKLPLCTQEQPSVASTIQIRLANHRSEIVQMNATFLVTIDLPSVEPGELLNVAEDITLDLTDSNFTVISVHPWDRPSQQAGPVVDPTIGLF